VEKGDLPRGNETVLVAEDEPSVRSLTVRVLQGLGYTVLETEQGAEALRLAREHAGEIHLLLTDVVMPLLGGKKLADELRVTRPDVKCLFISGYTDNAIVHQGILGEETAFLQKPFTAATLARKLREVLDG
jgi:CheY-like chemotaxis protein